ncbi:MAG: sulfatase [Planctomycetota bacterium]
MSAGSGPAARWARGLAASLVAAGVVAGGEVVLARDGWPRREGAFDLAAWLYLLATLAAAFAAAAAALLVLAELRLLLRARKGPARLDPGLGLVFALLLALFLRANRDTFSGAGIASHPWRDEIAALGLGLGGAVLLAVLRRLDRLLREGSRRERLLTALVAVAGGALFHLVDARAFPRLYAGLHLQAGALAALGYGLGAVLALSPLRLGRRFLAVTILLVGLAIAPAIHLRSAPERAAARTTAWLAAPVGAKWMRLAEIPLDRWRPVAAGRVEEGAETEARLLALRVPDPARAAALDALVPGRDRLNLVVVSLDTVRWDHTPLSGYARDTMPFLARLAEDAIVFERCWTSYPVSAHAYSSFLTGMMPSRAPSSAFVRGAYPEEEAPPGLAARLREAGWTTAADSAFNRGTASNLEVFGHLFREFEISNPDQRITARRGEELTPVALARLDELTAGERPFFYWLHYLDPHDPYRPHEERSFGTRPVDLYDGELAHVDRQLASIWEKLVETGVAARTVFVVMSDHGEEFGEHGGRFHDSSLYEEQTRVLFAMRVPGVGGRRARMTASLTDALPTLLELLDVGDRLRRDGTSLWPDLLGEDEPLRFAFSELFPGLDSGVGKKEAIVQGGMKLIVDRDRGIEELYDLEADPGERRNLVNERVDLAARMRGTLAVARRGLGASEAGERDVEDDLRRAFAAVGARPGLERGQLASELVRRLGDPVFGLKGEYARALRGPVRADALRFCSMVFHPEEPYGAFAAIRLATELGARELLPALVAQPLDHPLVGPQILVLRARLGDHTAGEEIERRLALAGVDLDREALLEGALLLGRPLDLDELEAWCRLRDPLVHARLLPALADRAAGRFLDLVEAMRDRPNWDFPPVKLAAVRGLSQIADPARATRVDRLLARFARDRSREVAAAARAALSARAGESTPAWLETATEVAAADNALSRGEYELAPRRLGRALAAAPAAAPRLALRAAAASRLAGDPEAAREIVGAALAGEAGATRPELEAFLANLGAPALPEVGDLAVAPRATRASRRTTLRQWTFPRIVLENRGARWSGELDPTAVRVRGRYVDETGQPVEAETFERGLGLDGLAAGDSRELVLPVFSPSRLGTFALEVRVFVDVTGRPPVEGPWTRVPDFALEVVEAGALADS